MPSQSSLNSADFHMFTLKALVQGWQYIVDPTVSAIRLVIISFCPESQISVIKPYVQNTRLSAHDTLSHLKIIKKSSWSQFLD